MRRVCPELIENYYTCKTKKKKNLGLFIFKMSILDGGNGDLRSMRELKYFHNKRFKFICYK